MWNGASEAEQRACMAWCLRATAMVQTCWTTGLLEIPVSVLNHLVFLAYDEWEKKFPSSVKDMYSVLLDKIVKPSPVLGQAFTPRQYLDKAADILDLRGNEINQLTLASAWVVSRWSVVTFRELSVRHFWKNQSRGAHEIEASKRMRILFNATVSNRKPLAPGAVDTPRADH